MPLTETAIKKYTAMLTQTAGGLPPTAQIIHNTIGNLTFTWEMLNVRTIVTLAGAFKDKSIVTLHADPSSTLWIRSDKIDDNSIYITAGFDYTDFTPDNWPWNNTPITIEIYNTSK